MESDIEMTDSKELVKEEVKDEELIESEEDLEEAKILLYKAVECIPMNLDMWMALAKLENYDKAKAVLNRARKSIPNEPTIWIAAAKLEESQGVPPD